MSLTKRSLAANNLIIAVQGEFFSDILAGDRKNYNFFHSVGGKPKSSFPFPFSFSEENRRLRRANVVYQALKGQKHEMVFVTISTNLG
jgi:hypothetical protein